MTLDCTVRKQVMLAFCAHRLTMAGPNCGILFISGVAVDVGADVLVESLLVLLLLESSLLMTTGGTPPAVALCVSHTKGGLGCFRGVRRRGLRRARAGRVLMKKSSIVTKKHSTSKQPKK